jgi:septal ring factor EnvC (AmiA/AmiB activator)
MSVAGEHVEFSDPGNSFSATFRKALKGFEIGGLAYSEVQFELKRLLAGVSGREVRELLRRSESVEPLPEYAYREVRRFLDEMIEQDVALPTDPGGVREQEPAFHPAALTAELQKSREALESERARVREAEEALSERILAEEAVRARLGITLHESERHQAELRAARNSIASRDNVIAQIRQTLDERDAQLDAIRREHAVLATALDLHSASGEQLAEELQVLRGQAADAASELAASREAVDLERGRRQEIERALTESNSLNSAARASLASKDKALGEMRQTLDDRNAQLSALRREHAELAAALNAQSTAGEQLTAELQALRAQAAAAPAELAASRDAADKERRKRQEVERALMDSNSLNSAARESLASKDEALTEMRQTLDERDAQLVALQRELQAALHASEEKLQAAQRRVVGANTDLDRLRAQAANLQARLRENDALIEKLGDSARSEAERAARWQAAAQQRESEATVTSAPMAAMPQVEALPRVDVRLPQVEVLPRARARAAQVSAALEKFLSTVRSRRWNIPTVKRPIWIGAAKRPIWIGAAVVLLATVIWFAVYQPSPMPSSSGESSATTAPAAASVEPTSVPTESVSANESPEQGAATPAAEKPMTAAAMLKANSRRCHAGDIEACYDAIRYRPSDPLLLSALGDALLRANRPADALRAYQRVAILAPNTPGMAAKISALEAKLSAKQASKGRSTHGADSMRNSNPAPQTQPH